MRGWEEWISIRDPSFHDRSFRFRTRLVSGQEKVVVDGRIRRGPA